MASEKMTNQELDALCKQNGIKGYSKLKKADKIAKLEEAGVKILADAEASKVKKAGSKAKAAETKEKKAAKPRVEKLDKKLIKHINLDNYKEQLMDFKEEVTHAQVIDMLNEDIKSFVDEANHLECVSFVDKFGALAAISYQRKNKNSKLSSKKDDEIYKILLLDAFLNKPEVLSSLVKAVEKVRVKLHKPAPEKKTKKNVERVVNDDDEDEDEDDAPEDVSIQDEPVAEDDAFLDSEEDN